MAMQKEEMENNSLHFHFIYYRMVEDYKGGNKMRNRKMIKKLTSVLVCSSMILGMLITPATSFDVNASEVPVNTEIESEDTNIDSSEEIIQEDTSEAENDVIDDNSEENNSNESIDEEENTEVTEETVSTQENEDAENETEDAENETEDTESLLEQKAGTGTYDVKKAFEVLSILNKARQSAGLKRISMDLNLYKTAEVRSAELVDKFSHVRPDGRGCFTAFPDVQVSMGENIAQGYSSPSSVMNAWMAEEAHKATILNSEYTSVGIACYYVPGSKYLYYWAQCFGDCVDVNIYLDGDSYTISGPTVYNGVNYAAVYDYSYYIKKYPWIEQKYGNDPEKVLAHFVKYGMKDGRQGCYAFNVQYYKNRYVDLRTAYGKDLPSYYMHYITNGKAEGRDAKTKCDLTGYVTKYGKVDYSAVYNYNYYIANNETVAKNFKGDDIGALEYFVKTGMKNGDQASANFDVASYANYYSVIRKKYKNNLEKYYFNYIVEGKDKGRIATGVTTMKNGVTVYNGTDYSAVYDLGYYANRYPGLKKMYGFDDDKYITHFVRYGMAEGRLGSAEFNPFRYRARYPYLKNKYGDDLKKYYLHYINAGKAEGRIGN